MKNVPQAAEFLGVSKATLYRRLNEGHVPAHCFTRDLGVLRFSAFALGFFRSHMRWPSQEELVSRTEQAEASP